MRYIKTSSFFYLKATFLFVLIFVLPANVFSQVGIGTTSPNASSILDISSTTQGLLAPRMTTTQRLAISTPAEGLLVFDINLDAFYYYDVDSVEWKKMITSTNYRDNYVLVKSEADFPAASGGIITLDENVLYEINGNITMTNSIDLNNATIIGHDIGEDILTMATGTLFVGNKGGELKNITLTASGGSVFNLDNSAQDQELIVITINISNSASLGTIKGYHLVSFSNCEYKGNVTGITFDSIKDLVLLNQEWLNSNSGIYETFTGTFDIVEKESGFSDVAIGVTAIDVSSNPILNRGEMLGVVFSGSGTYVNKYTTVASPFSFSNEWEIDCAAIPVESDIVAAGYYHMTGNATVTPLTTSNVPVKILGTTIADNLFRTTSTSNNLTYVGHKVREFEIICTGTLNHTVNNARKYEFHVFKNGVVVPAISAERRFSKNDLGNFAIAGVLTLEPNDYIEVCVSINNVSGVSDCLVERLSVLLK
ncbi:hypothetical protein BFR04_14670 [Gaetbulibacter sp. 4G1]|nr:hypothetical protein [Gaetbulibacter sp. 4G1]PIA81230.1 hypothetical protein BFR04_14670 [Gaetbulibacter sp. 4G1]